MPKVHKNPPTGRQLQWDHNRNRVLLYAKITQESSQIPTGRQLQWEHNGNYVDLGRLPVPTCETPLPLPT
jgi:hypothetical protein